MSDMSASIFLLPLPPGMMDTLYGWRLMGNGGHAEWNGSVAAQKHYGHQSGWRYSCAGRWQQETKRHHGQWWCSDESQKWGPKLSSSSEYLMLKLTLRAPAGHKLHTKLDTTILIIKRPQKQSGLWRPRLLSTVLHKEGIITSQHQHKSDIRHKSLVFLFCKL